jgi:hypothetical protein
MDGSLTISRGLDQRYHECHPAIIHACYAFGCWVFVFVIAFYARFSRVTRHPRLIAGQRLLMPRWLNVVKKWYAGTWGL